MRKIVKFTALLLVIVLLTGCAGVTAAMDGISLVKYEDMVYERPDMNRLQASLDAACEASKGEDVKEIIEAIYAFYDEYDAFYTNYALADLGSSHDLTDIFWEAEYAFCMENAALADAALEELYCVLADSPCREALETEQYFGEGYFDAYEGENMYDEGFLELLEQEASLQNEYYDLCTQALEYEYGTEEYYDVCGEPMVQLLADLIALRQEIAAYWGYEDYVQFANDFYYYRDYTPQQTQTYLEEIASILVPVYRNMDAERIWELSNRYCDEERMFSYVKKTARKMGGTIQEAFAMLDAAGLYDIAYGKNKYTTSYEIYLTSYYEPFVFVCPSMTRYDCLTFAHEFGHFCNDFACYGSYAGVDVLEFFSQGMEYLSLCYSEDAEDLKQIKMADSLCIYVEQAAFASFEQQMYSLQGEDLTVENLCSLYAEVAEKYGFDSVGYDNREFVTISHFYTSPMYILSYIFSNDAAMQLYEMEQLQPGAGLKLYENNLASQEVWFLTFLETAGLENPFTAGRVERIADTFREVLG